MIVWLKCLIGLHNEITRCTPDHLNGWRRCIYCDKNFYNDHTFWSDVKSMGREHAIKWGKEMKTRKFLEGITLGKD